MTIDEAIIHCEENVRKEEKVCNYECANEHRQLMNWLIQLRNIIEGEQK